MSQVSEELVTMLEEALGDKPRAALSAARSLADEVDWLQRQAVAHARANGYNWGQIGRLLGLTRQGARKRFPPASAAPAPHVVVRNARLEAENAAETMLQRFRDGHATKSSSISQQS